MTSAGQRATPDPRSAERRAGFTVLELLVVITLIALLAAVMLGAGRRVSEVGRVTQARAELAVIAAGLDTYRQRHGDYPRTASSVELVQALLGRRSPTGMPLISRACLSCAGMRLVKATGEESADAAELVDPWSRAYVYVYRVPADGWANSRPVLYSCGPDGEHAPALLAGGFPDRTAAPNHDNLYADR